MQAFEFINIEKENHLAVVTLNKPNIRNALSSQFLAEIEQCALSFREDADTRVVIFTGAGKHFSAGADLNEFQRNDEPSLLLKRRRLRIGERVMKAILDMDQITICAWNGGAIGGGGCIATAMDFRIGAADCFLFYPEIELGLNLMWQSLPRTVRLVGETKALRLAIGAERVEADELLQWGLVEKVVPVEALLSSAETFAQTYINKPPIAAQMIKRSVNAFGRQLDGAVMHMDADQHFLTSKTQDHPAAVDAYLNKKTPSFTGD